MKKTMVITLLMLGPVVAFSAPTVLALQQKSQPKAEETVEKSWQQSLEAQVALAKARVALLQARSELWLSKKKEGALSSLEESVTYLNEAYRSADTSTRNRITDLKNQVEMTEQVVQEKGQAAGSELDVLAFRTEAVLGSAIAETQDRAAVLKEETFARLALTQAKAAQLQAKIALEVDKAPEKARQALTEAETYLVEAGVSGSKWTARGIIKLQTETRQTMKALTENVGEAERELNALIAHTQEQIKAYGTQIGESEEVGLLKKRYAQLEAQAALLKAQFAAEKEETYERAKAHLDDAKIWYARSKGKAEEGISRKITAIEEHIDDAKVILKKKSKSARKEIADLLNRAADIVKGGE